MCKCACFNWFKKIFGSKKNCCGSHSSETKKEDAVSEGPTPEPVVNVPSDNEVSRERKENTEQK